LLVECCELVSDNALNKQHYLKCTWHCEWITTEL